MRRKLRVFLAEDQTILRQSLRALIGNHPNLQVVGEAGDGEETVRLVKSLQPDIVVMDVSMPVMNGLQATEEIRRQENSPITKGFLRFLGAAFTKHPYAWTAGGTIADLDRTTPEDLKKFYDAYYQPSNALVVVVGISLAR